MQQQNINGHIPATWSYQLHRLGSATKQQQRILETVKEQFEKPCIEKDQTKWEKKTKKNRLHRLISQK